MNIGTWVIAGLVLIAIAIAVRSLWKTRKQGGCAGCSGCTGCASTDTCAGKTQDT